MPYLGVLVLVIWVAALIDVVVADDRDVRHLPKVVWLIVVLLVPLAGSLVWFIVGRPAGEGLPSFDRAPHRSGAHARQSAAPANPDDDEEFLRSIRERAEEQRRKGRELREQGDESAES